MNALPYGEKGVWAVIAKMSGHYQLCHELCISCYLSIAPAPE